MATATAPKPTPKPTTPPPPGRQWVPTYGWWRPSANVPYRKYIKGWHLSQPVAAPKPETHPDPKPGYTPPAQTAPQPAAPPPPPTPPPVRPWNQWADADYLDQLRAAEAQRDASLNPLQSRLSQLNYRGEDGMTEEERRRNRLNADAQRMARSMISSMARSGLLLSGERDRQTQDQSRDYQEGEIALRNEWGDLARKSTADQIDALNAAFNKQMQDMANAATIRWQQAEEQRVAAAAAQLAAQQQAEAEAAAAAAAANQPQAVSDPAGAVGGGSGAKPAAARTNATIRQGATGWKVGNYVRALDGDLFEIVGGKTVKGVYLPLVRRPGGGTMVHPAWQELV